MSRNRVVKRRDKLSAKGPARSVTRGSVTVKIYQGTNRKPDGREYPVFTVVYFEHSKRRRKFFATMAKARGEAGKIVERLDRGEREVLKMTNADASSYVRALELLQPLGVPLHLAVEDYAHAMKLSEGRPLADLAREFAARHRANVRDANVPAVVEELLQVCDREEKSERYQETLRSHLNRFKARETFAGPISRVTTLQMEGWLSALGMTGRTRNNVRATLVTLFHFARKRGYLPRGVSTEADEIGRSRVEASSANVYSAAEITKLLAAASPVILPVFAIGAFTGLRSASIARLRWENVKWEQSVIEIPAAIAKNRKRYLAPLLPCLAAWLAPYCGRKGLVVDGVKLDERQRKTFEAAGVKRLHNGLRDSFISYRVAQTQNIPQVAYEAGNSVEMIRSKYLEARTKAEAEAWFSVMPNIPSNVVSITNSK